MMISKVFSALLFFVPWFALGQTRLLVPRADSPTAMVRCGADLENVKASQKLTRQYVFNGSETLHDMQYCVVEAGEVHIARGDYRVPVGTVGWLSDDGTSVVLEQCVNQARCEGCTPISPPAPPPTPEVQLPAAPPPIQLNELPPATEPWQPEQFEFTILWPKVRPKWSYIPGANCAYQLIPGLGGFKRHGAWDIVEKGACGFAIGFGIAEVVGGAAALVKIGFPVIYLPPGI